MEIEPLPVEMQSEPLAGASFDYIVQKVQHLSGVELTILLSFMAREHCLIQTQPKLLNHVSEAIESIARHAFGFQVVHLNCSTTMTISEFCQGLLTSAGPADQIAKIEEERAIANIIVARNFSEVPDEVQMQALELIRKRRVSVLSEMYQAPNLFLFLPLISSASPQLSKHLNDFMFISHYHDAESLDESLWSGIILTQPDLRHLELKQREVVLTIEMKRYLHDVLIFLRMHRAVAGGIGAKASGHFEKLVRCLALLNNLIFVTPSIIALAARKIYRHRIQLTTVEHERSMQYGSDAVVVASILDGITPDLIIEQVLQQVEVSL